MVVLARRIIDAVKARGRRVQAAAVVLGLWALYWLGLGPARLLASLFRRDLLSDHQDEDASSWRDIAPGDLELSSFEHQS